MDKTIKILHVEDSDTDAELIKRELLRSGLRVEIVRVETSEEFSEQLGRFSPDIILSDFTLPRFDGLAALSIARLRSPDVSFIFVSGTINEEVAIAALQGGATDYVLKTNMKRLASAVQRALSDSNERNEQKRAQARFRDLIEFSPNALVVVNEQNLISIVNAQTEALFGFAREEVIGISYRVLGDQTANGIPERVAHFRETHKQPRSPQPVDIPFELYKARCRRKNGSEFWGEVYLSPMHTGDELWICASIVDITERIAQEERVSRMLRIQTVLSNINAAGIRIREQELLCQEVCEIVVNDGAYRQAWIGLVAPGEPSGKVVAWTGEDQAYIDHVRLTSIVDDEGSLRPPSVAFRTKVPVVCNNIANEQTMAAAHEVALRNGFHSMVALPLLVDGEAVGVLVIYAGEIDFFSPDEMQLLTRLANDVSFSLEHQQYQKRLAFLAFHDSLTELPNRLHFIDQLHLAIAEAEYKEERNLALILVDINRFRNINDTLGRDAGDRILLEMKQRIRGSLPTLRSLARIDSNCFAVVAAGCLPEDDLMATIGQSMDAHTAKPLNVSGREIRISLRAGIAMLRADGSDAMTLLQNAEAALRSAKVARVQLHRYHAGMNVQMADKLSMETRLKQALEKDQFLLHYQPKFELNTKKLIGMEALIRWNDPAAGLVPPVQFIALMEETGLIIDVGTWVIKEACRQHLVWREQGLNVPKIAVNVSQLQIRQSDFVQRVLAMVDAVGPQALEVEITESLFADDMDEHIEKLTAIRNAGITIAMDDFGTGYSSLSYIARLPIDTLKIDKSFIDDINTSADHMAIVSTIISLAHGLSLNVVAEGVETEEQASLLKLLRCNQVQGYLYGRPLPAEQFEKLLV